MHPLRGEGPFAHDDGAITGAVDDGRGLDVRAGPAVDVDGDVEGDEKNAKFTFTPRPKPLPAETFDVEPEDEVRDIEPQRTEPETQASEFPDERDGDDADQNGNQPNEGNGPEPV